MPFVCYFILLNTACTCQEEEEEERPDLVKVIISSSGKPVVVTPFDQKLRDLRTLKQHYYPEGGWGWVVITVAVLVNIITYGMQMGLAVLFIHNFGHFSARRPLIGHWAPVTGWLGALSPSISLLMSPVTIAFCRRKSTRLTAVIGGLVSALGCLFTSFASQFHQVFFSYGIIIGVGVGMILDTSTLMVGQYFKRRRELVEIFLVSGRGIGISIMYLFIQGTIRSIGWRLGLQALTGIVFSTFILGIFYRSATLYHPQRRAILHLKSQKRKIKDKNKSLDDKPPFFDLSCLKSRTIQILLVSTGVSALGVNSPIYFLANQITNEGFKEKSVLLLEGYLGIAWTMGCCIFGSLVVQKSGECRIGRQYLCQASILICGISILALTSVQGYNGYVIFVWVYGIFIGGYNYSLKMYVYQKVRARNFARAWGYIQCSQAIPNMVGIPIAGYINVGWGSKVGYYFSATCVLLGGATLFLIDVHKNQLRKRHKLKHRKSNGTVGENSGEFIINSEKESAHERKLSFPEDDFLQPMAFMTAANSLEDLIDLKKQEPSHFSEEGIADMDIPDNILDELEYLDNITSCDKVENYLMLSEYEQNLIKEIEGPAMSKRARKWSLVRQASSLKADDGDMRGQREVGRRREMSIFKSGWRLPGANRSITTIEENSV